MPVKAVVDTNIWVSALVAPSGTAAQIVELWKDGRFKLLISEQQSSELYEVLSRSELTVKYSIDEQKVSDLLLSIAENAQHVFLEDKDKINVCRDPDDNLIIETAVRGKAKYLITGDRDITDDKRIASYLLRRGVTVISLSKFLSLINKP